MAVTAAEVDLPDPSGDAGVGRVVSVNVGTPRVVDWFGRQVTTSIWKEPVDGPVPVAGVNLDGDDQADRRVHGGPDMAVYAYAAEDYEWWSEKLGVPLGPGTFGENLTLEGIDLHACAVGETWAVGTAQLRVTQPRFPCFKLGIRMGDAGFVERFAAARRFGTYFAIEGRGTIGAGDAARRLSRPGQVLTIGDVISAYEDADIDLLRRLADHDLVPDSWRVYARRALRRHTAKPSA
ncbi:MAG TPA: MOSC domain-containing protein [Acidimicrobiales bacterium]|nr:MOSC domain-containing protein [Acidimicrobiales bacterium]